MLTSWWLTPEIGQISESSYQPCLPYLRCKMLLGKEGRTLYGNRPTVASLLKGILDCQTISSTKSLIFSMSGEKHTLRGMVTLGRVPPRRLNTFLRYLASGGFHRQVGLAVGIAKPTAILHSNNVADFFLDIAHRHISFPEQDEFERLAQRMLDVNGVERHVILYIDGVIVEIQRPDLAVIYVLSKCYLGVVKVLTWTRM